MVTEVEAIPYLHPLKRAVSSHSQGTGTLCGMALCLQLCVYNYETEDQPHPPTILITALDLEKSLG